MRLLLVPIGQTGLQPRGFDPTFLGVGMHLVVALEWTTIYGIRLVDNASTFILATISHPRCYVHCSNGYCLPSPVPILPQVRLDLLDVSSFQTSNVNIQDVVQWTDSIIPN